MAAKKRKNPVAALKTKIAAAEKKYIQLDKRSIQVRADVRRCSAPCT
jgi:hypothetical protein